GEEAGTPVIFSHFNAQGAHNYGRAKEGAQLIEDARARGVQVWAAQHVYTATQSNLRSYTIPGWAVAGGHEAMVARFNHPDTVQLLDVQTMEMLAIRGGAEKLLFGDPRPDLNGKTLAQVSEDWDLPVPATVRKILSEANAVVMNLDLYDIENTRYLAQQPWMMTCTDGRTPKEGQKVVHPRVYGSFSRKIAQFVLDEKIISMPFAIRSMTGLAADFLGLPDRGYLREGMKADIAIFDQEYLQDKATYQQPHQYSDGTVHVLVNGQFALRDGKHTGRLSGRPLLRGGAEYDRNR
ncbi:MAG: amidohydrolase family protein, partial [Fidelibacterota bacterium]